MKTVQQAQSNWTSAGPRATTDWVAGITNTQKDQAALAAAAAPRWFAGVQDAYANNRFQNGVQRRGTAYWKSQSEAKQGSYTQGYTAGANNYGLAAAKFMPAIAQGVASLPPRGDLAANLQRSASLATYLHGLKGQLKAG